VEILEERVLLANSLLWIGPANGLWSVANNWAIMGGAGGNAAPVNGDTVVFSPSTGVNGQNGTNTNSKDDIASLSVSEVNPLDNTFTSTITLNQSLTVTNNLPMISGTIQSPGSITVKDPQDKISPTFDWQGGTINANITLGTATGQNNPATTIHPLTALNYGADTLTNYGTITWTRGNIVADSCTITNNSPGVFDIQCNANLTRVVGAFPSITNNGTFKKSSGTGTTSIDADFTNTSQFSLLSGIVQFESGNLITQTGGSTVLNGGNLNVARTYYVSGGSISGVGTIGQVNSAGGNLSTDVAGETGTGTGSVHPGVGTGPGTLNVAGNYTQTSGGSLVINSDAAGNIGLLNVQGTLATLAGAVTVTRDPNWKPSTGRFSFLKWVSVTGDFDPNKMTINNNAPWTVGTHKYTFVFSKGTRDYAVVPNQGMYPSTSPLELIVSAAGDENSWLGALLRESVRYSHLAAFAPRSPLLDALQSNYAGGRREMSWGNEVTARQSRQDAVDAVFAGGEDIPFQLEMEAAVFTSFFDRNKT
jgi:hypothetical protein